MIEVPARGGLKLLKCSSSYPSTAFGGKDSKQGGAVERELLENFPGIRTGMGRGLALKMADALFEVYFLSFPPT